MTGLQFIVVSGALLLAAHMFPRDSGARTVLVVIVMVVMVLVAIGGSLSSLGTLFS